MQLRDTTSALGVAVQTVTKAAFPSSYGLFGIFNANFGASYLVAGATVAATLNATCSEANALSSCTAAPRRPLRRSRC